MRIAPTARRLALIAATIAAWGCGDDDDPGRADAATGGADAAIADAGVPDATPAPTIADICGADDGVFVDLLATILDCNPELGLLFGGLPDRATLSVICDDVLAPYVADGTAILGDGAALAACAEWIAGLDCDHADFDTPGSPCDALVVGTQSTGDACDTDVQCAGESFCDDSAGGDCGECAERRTDGLACDADDECLGRRCRGADEGVQGTCATAGDTGDPCVDNDDCLGRMVCDRATQQCALEPDWQVGTPCAEFPFDCNGVIGDLFCDPTTAMCAAYRELDATCGFPVGDGLCRVFEYETCQEDVDGRSVCTAPMLANLGETCGFFIGRQCLAGVACADHDGDDATEDRCVIPGAKGDSCAAPGEICGPLLDCIADTCQYANYTGACP